VKTALRPVSPRRSAPLALAVFLLAYAAALALVLAPEQVKGAFDAPWSKTLAGSASFD
jgi:hypothetical protein